MSDRATETGFAPVSLTEAMARGSGFRPMSFASATYTAQATEQESLDELDLEDPFALGLADELRPFADEVDRRFQDWTFRHNARRTTAFTPEQMDWLRLMKDHIAASCSIERDDFDYAELASRGGLQKAWQVLGSELDTLMAEMNEELVA